MVYRHLALTGRARHLARTEYGLLRGHPWDLWPKERLNKGWGMDEGNGDLLTGDGTG